MGEFSQSAEILIYDVLKNMGFVLKADVDGLL
jgi:hypothetical protein